jgi:hypothetical protein
MVCLNGEKSESAPDALRNASSQTLNSPSDLQSGTILEIIRRKSSIALLIASSVPARQSNGRRVLTRSIQQRAVVCEEMLLMLPPPCPMITGTTKGGILMHVERGVSEGCLVGRARDGKLGEVVGHATGREPFRSHIVSRI